MRCTFHPGARAATLCACCGRVLCATCAAPSPAGRVCAPGCDAPAVLAVPEVVVVAARARATVARWARLGATSFLLAIGAAVLHIALLSTVGYVASLICLSAAWRHRRRTRYLRWWCS
jgi:hypothetical protein